MQLSKEMDYTKKFYYHILMTKKILYKLINKQRNHKLFSISELFIDDVHVTEAEMIRKGCALYFERLATPVEDQKFDNTFKSKLN